MRATTLPLNTSEQICMLIRPRHMAPEIRSKCLSNAVHMLTLQRSFLCKIKSNEKLETVLDLKEE